MMNLVQTKNRMTFTDVWDEASKMLNDFKASPFYDTTNFNIGDSSVTMTYFLLYNRYGNTEIINNDLNQFKYKLFGVMGHPIDVRGESSGCSSVMYPPLLSARIS